MRAQAREAWRDYAAGTEARHFVKFAREHLIQSEGRWEGQPLKLEPWQRRNAGRGAPAGGIFRSPSRPAISTPAPATFVATRSSQTCCACATTKARSSARTAWARSCA